MRRLALFLVRPRAARALAGPPPAPQRPEHPSVVVVRGRRRRSIGRSCATSSERLAGAEADGRDRRAPARHRGHARRGRGGARRARGRPRRPDDRVGRAGAREGAGRRPPADVRLAPWRPSRPARRQGRAPPIDLAHPDQVYPGLRRDDRRLARRRKDKPIATGDDRASDAAPRRRSTPASRASPRTSVPGLLNAVDGTTVETAAGPVELRTRIATDAAAGERAHRRASASTTWAR